MKKTIAALVAAVTLGGVSGSASAGTVTILGPPSCGKWVEEHASIPSTNAGFRQEIWLAAYLSGAATYSKHDILRDTDSDSLSLWMTNYCKENPLNNIADGAGDLYSILKKKKGIK